MLSAEEVIQKLNLAPLPNEGGFFARTYTSAQTLQLADGRGERRICTAIYYLITPEGFSALHRITSDEMFHFYAGDPVEMIQIDEGGRLRSIVIGNDIASGQQPQVLVARDIWQATALVEGGKWALLGTTVAPGFEYEDFTLADRADLIRKYPLLCDEITRLTRI